jgi:hypothetical protein
MLFSSRIFTFTAEGAENAEENRKENSGIQELRDLRI